MPADITTERLLAAMTWEWQDVDDLMEALMSTVAPGKALRTYQNRSGKYVKGGSGRPVLTEAEKIASGQRSIVNDRIGSQVESGRLELERLPDGRRRLRFRERREVADARGACRTCNRPFPKATAEKPQLLLPPPPRPRPKVVYPSFPQWERDLSTGSSQ